MVGALNESLMSFQRSPGIPIFPRHPRHPTCHVLPVHATKLRCFGHLGRIHSGGIRRLEWNARTFFWVGSKRKKKVEILQIQGEVVDSFFLGFLQCYAFKTTCHLRRFGLYIFGVLTVRIGSCTCPDESFGKSWGTSCHRIT